MNEIFAVDPKAFSNALELKYLFERFGFHEGRFVGQLPKKWRLMAEDHIRNWPDGARKSAQVLLDKYYRDRVIRLGYPYQSDLPWLDNAIDAKERGAVADVIAARESGDKVSTIDDIDDDYFRRWGGRQFEVMSSAEKYAHAASLLLSYSHEVVFVDPYIISFRGDFQRVLEEMALMAKAGSKCNCFKVFTINDRSTIDQIKKAAPRFFRPIYERGIAVEFSVLQDVGDPNADDHSRYLFSIKGAMQFDHGFDEESPPRKRKVSFVDSHIHNLLCSQYLEGNLPFKVMAHLEFPSR